VERVINTIHLQKYENHLDIVERSNKNNPNEKQLFHGSAFAKKIAKNGFDERYSNQDGMFGAGTYISRSFRKSNILTMAKITTPKFECSK
jgi:hypothetical protein